MRVFRDRAEAEKAPRRKLADRECPQCKRMYRPRHNGKIYCSPACKYAGYKFTGQRKQVSWYSPHQGYINGLVIENGVARNVSQHRYFMEKQIGRRLLRAEHVHHINGNGLDNRLENLQLISPAEHARLHNVGRTDSRGRKLKMSAEARRARSEKSAARHAASLSPDRPYRRGTKLTVDQVILMRHQRLTRTFTDAEIGAAFGVAASTVQRICAGQKWPHVPGPLTPPKPRYAQGDAR